MQLICPKLDYADIVYGNTSETSLRPLNVVYVVMCECPCASQFCPLWKKQFPENWINISGFAQGSNSDYSW